MANLLYNTGRIGFLTNVVVGDHDDPIDWVEDEIHAALVDNTYVSTASETNTNFGDVLANVVATEELTGRAVSSTGQAVANNTTFSAVSGSDVYGVVVYKVEGADEADWPLIGFFDTGVGLPISPNGGDITVLWNGGGGEVFRI